MIWQTSNLLRGFKLSYFNVKLTCFNESLQKNAAQNGEEKCVHNLFDFSLLLSHLFCNRYWKWTQKFVLSKKNNICPHHNTYSTVTVYSLPLEDARASVNACLSAIIDCCPCSSRYTPGGEIIFRLIHLSNIQNTFVFGERACASATQSHCLRVSVWCIFTGMGTFGKIARFACLLNFFILIE